MRGEKEEEKRGRGIIIIIKRRKYILGKERIANACGIIITNGYTSPLLHFFKSRKLEFQNNKKNHDHCQHDGCEGIKDNFDWKTGVNDHCLK